MIMMQSFELISSKDCRQQRCSCACTICTGIGNQGHAFKCSRLEYVAVVQAARFW